MDLIILIVIIILTVLWKRNFKSFVYFISLTEILFRILTYINENVNFQLINDFITKYIPKSIFDILANYSNGLLYDILSWLLVLCFIMFEYYIIRVFIKRRK